MAARRSVTTPDIEGPPPTPLRRASDAGWVKEFNTIAPVFFDIVCLFWKTVGIPETRMSGPGHRTKVRAWRTAALYMQRQPALRVGHQHVARTDSGVVRSSATLVPRV
jgi:hypothetical protein